jgi:putative endonuclease
MSAAKQIQGSVSYYAGQAAENAVARDYVRRGFTLASERWRGKRGEIDLIMRHGPDLVFVEVKKSKSFQHAALRITRRQMDRIFGSAEEFLANEPNGSLTNVRFDVALVDQTGQLRIVENAFGHD